MNINKRAVAPEHTHHWVPQRDGRTPDGSEPAYSLVCRYCGITYRQWLIPQDGGDPADG